MTVTFCSARLRLLVLMAAMGPAVAGSGLPLLLCAPAPRTHTVTSRRVSTDPPAPCTTDADVSILRTPGPRMLTFLERTKGDVLLCQVHVLPCSCTSVCESSCCHSSSSVAATAARC